MGELAARTNMPASTASLLVDQLVVHGLLRRDAQHQVRIGVSMWELAARASPALALREVAMPFMEDLQAVGGQHTQLRPAHATWGAGGPRGALCRAAFRPGSGRQHHQGCREAAMHASSGWLVLLAHSRSAVLEAVLLGGPLRRIPMPLSPTLACCGVCSRTSGNRGSRRAPDSSILPPREWRCRSVTFADGWLLSFDLLPVVTC